MGPSEAERFNISRATHPLICMLHIGAKASTIFAYLFMSLINKSSVHTFILVVIMSAVEFWIVKNVSGRYLVGMRWWNGEEGDTAEQWFFESTLNFSADSEIDANVFWGGMMVSTGFWGVLLFVKMLSFSVFWGMLVFIAFSLNATNLYGYYLCRSDRNDKLSKVLAQAQRGLRSSVQFLQAVTHAN